MFSNIFIKHISYDKSFKSLNKRVEFFLVHFGGSIWRKNIFMDQKRNQVAINKKAVISLRDSHSSKFRAIKQFSGWIKVTCHHRRIFSVISSISKCINSNFFWYSLKSKLKIWQNLSHVILKVFNKDLKSFILTISSFLPENIF